MSRAVCGFFPLIGQRVVAVILVLAPHRGVAAATHPLEPLDTSSPRATLHGFLTTTDAALRLIRDDYWDSSSYADYVRMADLPFRAMRVLDLREVPPAARAEVGRYGLIYLYEVLSRIELPPEEEIPDAAAFADPDDEEPAPWTIPHTEITLARVEQGPRAGEFLFSPATVDRAEEFYAKTRALPYRRDVPLRACLESLDRREKVGNRDRF
jgi:MscS family membrane protein